MEQYQYFCKDMPVPEGVFDQFFSLLERSLPKEEFRDKPGQKNLLTHSNYQLLARMDGEELTAALAWWQADAFRFIEHLVVDGSLRGKGIGGELLELFCKKEKTAVLLEVEPPDSTEFASRRIAFYQRHGFSLNLFPYMQPPLWEGAEPMPLKIMSYPGPISEQEFRSDRKTLYRIIYGLPSDSPLMQSIE